LNQYSAWNALRRLVRACVIDHRVRAGDIDWASLVSVHVHSRDAEWNLRESNSVT